MPATVFLDPFVGTNGQTLADRGYTIDQSGASGEIQSNEARIRVNATGSYYYYLAPTGNVANVSVYYRWRYSVTSIGAVPLFYIRTNTAQTVGYALELYPNNRDARIFNVDGFAQLAFQANFRPDVAATTNQWVRFEATGTTIRAKAWGGAIGDEPGGWGMSISNALYATGRVGGESVRWQGSGQVDKNLTYLEIIDLDAGSTPSGASTAPLVAHTAGAGRKVARGGSTAIVDITGTGTGLKRATGAATAALTATGEGAGHADHATPSGASEAPTTVSVEGAGHKQSHGGATSHLDVHTTGAGRKVARGSSEVVTLIITDGTGTKTARGAATATLVAHPDTDGHKTTGGASEALLTVTPEGAGRPVAEGQGASTAPMVVTSQGHGHKQTTGTATSHITAVADGYGWKVARGSSEATVLIDTHGQSTTRRHGSRECVVEIHTDGRGRPPYERWPHPIRIGAALRPAQITGTTRRRLPGRL